MSYSTPSQPFLHHHHHFSPPCCNNAVNNFSMTRAASCPYNNLIQSDVSRFKPYEVTSLIPHFGLHLINYSNAASYVNRTHEDVLRSSAVHSAPASYACIHKQSPNHFDCSNEIDCAYCVTSSNICHYPPNSDATRDHGVREAISSNSKIINTSKQTNVLCRNDSLSTKDRLQSDTVEGKPPCHEVILHNL